MSDESPKVKSRNPVIEFDRLKMYFGYPYTIDLETAEGSLTIYCPSLGEVIEYGESKFYGNLNIFVSNTTSYRLPLWEGGVDWNEISDFELFLQLYSQVDPEFSKLIFHDIDFSKFEIYQRKISEEEAYPVLYNEEYGIEINEEVYFYLSQYLRNLCNVFPKEQITPDQFLKDLYIQKDKREARNLEFKRKNGKDENVSLQPIISACVNHPGFKYRLNELKEVGFNEFMDSVSRLNIYENTRAILNGSYSGFADMSKVDSNLFNFMREVK